MKRTFERLLNIFQTSFFKFLLKSGFCNLCEKILQFVRKATEGQIIELRDVGFSYPGYPDPVLQKINLTCKEGEKIAIVGENGCGKSTLVKLLLNFYLPDYGELKFEGIPYEHYFTTELRSNFGVFFQDFQIYAFSIAENVLMRKVESEEDRALVKKALEFSGLWEKVSTLDQQIDTVLTKELSFAYPCRLDAKVLKHINLTIHEGEKLAVVGVGGIIRTS